MRSARTSTRFNVPRGHTASAGGANSARNSSMSPSSGSARQVSGAIERGFEFLPGEIFAAQDAVAIEHAELDVRELALAHDLLGVRRGLDLARLHAGSLLRRPRARARIRSGAGSRGNPGP